jgi:hypothetical protein
MRDSGRSFFAKSKLNFGLEPKHCAMTKVAVDCRSNRKHVNENL